ncbi:AAA family ATPase [Candidatus Bathyarchaeota archaeon]|nr:AAA family ATPase [Candidatus Bathyarchaeota archaeon]
MLIREVVLENFMSYEYARVPLKRGVNLVVGPNGSGKSSLLLGICVALGETYTERSKRLSDLIRYGQNQARISVLLDNSKKNGQRPLPQFDSDIIRLTRILRRDGRYFFEINQRSAQKYEVQEMLERLGFDPDNMLIIMHQNMPENFANLPPQEKLRILEEAVGYSSLRADVIEAKKKLRSILSEEESLNQLLERARETLNYWREQNEKLQEKRKLRLRINFLQQELAWSRVAELERVRGGIQQEIEQLDSDLYSTEAEIERLGKLVFENGELLIKQREELSALIKKKIESEKKIGVCEYGLSVAKKRLEKLDPLLETSNTRQLKFEENFKTVKTKLKPDLNTLDDFFKIIREIEENQSEVYNIWLEDLRSQKRDAEETVQSLMKQLEEAESNASLIAEEMKMVQKIIDEANERYVEARIQMALTKEKRNILQKRMDELKRELDKCLLHLKDAEAEALIKGSRIDTGRSLDEIFGDIKKTSGMLLVLGNVSEEAEGMYESYLKTFNELSVKAAQVQEGRRQAMIEVEGRSRRWLELTQSLIDKVNERYKRLLEMLQANGEVRLTNPNDIEEAGLELYVGFKGAVQSKLDSYTHSGGERSTAVMAFLLSLQQNVVSSFRGVDEFDLHMDPKNREIVSNFIASTLEDTDDQYLVITPSQVTSRGENVHIIMVHKTESASLVTTVEAQ